MIQTTCAWCNNPVKVYPSNLGPRNYRSRDCRNKAMAERNRKNNPTLMTTEIKAKLREARLGTGGGVTYTKTYGRHTHRIVAEEMLGRPLKRGEVVHHIDGNKRNNAPENLMVFSSQSEHVKWHAAHKGGDS